MKRNSNYFFLFGTVFVCLILFSSPSTATNVSHLTINPFSCHVATQKLSDNHMTSSNDPIFIDGNQNFTITALNEGWSGDGSAPSPYVIRGYEITSNTVNLIEIRNTNVHFKITESTLNGLSSLYDGISLVNVTNACIRNNTIQQTWMGVRLKNVTNSSVSDNIITKCEATGVYSLLSESIEITGNTLSNNGKSGVSAHSIYEPHIYLSGIYLDQSQSHLIRNNIINNNWYTGLTIYLSSWNTIDNNTIVDTVDTNGAGFWFWATSEYNTISENIIQSLGTGFRIEGRFFSHNLLTRNIFSQNNIAIGLKGTNNTVSSNILYDNEFGFNLGYRWELTVDEKAAECIIEHNQIHNNTHGIFLEWADDNLFRNNSIYFNLRGVAIDSDCRGNTFQWNDFIANEWSHAKDDGTNNSFVSNYWYDWTDITKPYAIAGLAENTDSSPLASKVNPDSPDIAAPLPPASTSWFLVPIFLMLLCLSVIKRKTQKK
ncbi:MAG: nitrous oxide reductase family maturation protein NosD [Promethearchaeota archaeon]